MPMNPSRIGIRKPKCRAETVTVRKYWSEIFDDLESEHRKDLLKKDRETRKHKDRSLLLERQVDAALDKTKEWRQKYYEQSERIEELEEKNKNSPHRSTRILKHPPSPHISYP